MQQVVCMVLGQVIVVLIGLGCRVGFGSGKMEILVEEYIHPDSSSIKPTNH